MIALVDFFTTDPQVLAREPFLKRLRLQYLFNDKNLFRYHRDFLRRWKMIFETTLVKDLHYVASHPESFESNILETLNREIEVILPDSLETFVKLFEETIFDDLNFCAKIFQQISQYPEHERPILYQKSYQFLKTFQRQCLENSDTSEQYHWNVLSAFFRDRQGQITTFFRAIAAHILFSPPSHLKAQSAASLNKKSSKKAKNFSKSLSDIDRRFSYERSLIKNFFNQIPPPRANFRSHMAAVLLPVQQYFYQNYAVTVSAYESRHFGTVMQFYLKNQEIGRVSRESFLGKSKVPLDDFLSKIFVTSLIAHRITALYDLDPMRPRHYLTPVLELEEEEQDSDNEQQLLERSSFSSSSSRQRSLSLEEELSSFGHQWVKESEQQKWPSLLKKIADYYGWPLDFITVALSSVDQECFIPTAYDRVLFTPAQFDLQRKIFSLIKIEYAKICLHRFNNQSYGQKKLILPFLHKNLKKNSAYFSVAQWIDQINLFDTSQRYQELDTQSLEAIMSFFPSWPEKYDIDLIKEAFNRNSKSLLEMILQKKAVYHGPWGSFFSSRLIWQEFDLIDVFLRCSSCSLISDDWFPLLEWAAKSQASCSLGALKFYQQIKKEFFIWVLANGLEDIWLKIADYPPIIALITQWFYQEQDPTMPTLLQQQTLTAQSVSYQKWEAECGNPISKLKGLWSLVLEHERNGLARSFAKICLNLKVSLREIIEDNCAYAIDNDSPFEYLRLLTMLLKQDPSLQPEVIAALLTVREGGQVQKNFCDMILRELAPQSRGPLLLSIRQRPLHGDKKEQKQQALLEKISSTRIFCK